MRKSDELKMLARSGIQPRGLSRAQAATYINVSPPTFDLLVEEGVMPRPRKLRGRKVWDRLDIDAYFARIPYDDGTTADPAASTSSVWDRVSL